MWLKKKKVTTSTQDHLEMLESLSDDFRQRQASISIDYQYLKSAVQVNFFMKFIFDHVHMTICKVNAGFNVFKNTWAKNAEKKCFLF